MPNYNDYYEIDFYELMGNVCKGREIFFGFSSPSLAVSYENSALKKIFFL